MEECYHLAQAVISGLEQRGYSIVPSVNESSQSARTALRCVVPFVSFPAFEATIEAFMQALAPRFIDAAEATRLGVRSGWYGSKASGTFVTGPHETEKDCERTLAAQKK